MSILDNDPDTIRSYVTNLAPEYEPGPSAFLKDLFQGGCASCFVGGLIYYADTWAFFDTYYEDISALLEEYEDSTGGPLQIQGDMKNFLAWFGFEATALQVASGFIKPLQGANF